LRALAELIFYALLTEGLTLVLVIASLLFLFSNTRRG